MWDLAAPQEPIRRIETAATWGVALSPDGQLLYLGGWQLDPQLAAIDRPLSVYDV